MSEIYEARDSFSTEDPDGGRVHVYHGDTVREGHWLLTNLPDAFVPLNVKFDVAPPPAPVAKPVVVKPLAPKA